MSDYTKRFSLHSKVKKIDILNDVANIIYNKIDDCSRIDMTNPDYRDKDIKETVIKTVEEIISKYDIVIHNDIDKLKITLWSDFTPFVEIKNH